MPNHRITLSKDVVEKAEIIAREFGLKGVKDAVEAVFRRYSDEYLHRYPSSTEKPQTGTSAVSNTTVEPTSQPMTLPPNQQAESEALSELNDLLGD